MTWSMRSPLCLQRRASCTVIPHLGMQTGAGRESGILHRRAVLQPAHSVSSHIDISRQFRPVLLCQEGRLFCAWNGQMPRSAVSRLVTGCFRSGMQKRIRWELAAGTCGCHWRSDPPESSLDGAWQKGRKAGAGRRPFIIMCRNCWCSPCAEAWRHPAGVPGAVPGGWRHPGHN